MTDLHTHILPGMDDGARNVEESLALLRMEWKQGVDTVVLTPHFYRGKENPKHFLERRKKATVELIQALRNLPEEERNALPRLRLGAEVAWAPNLAYWDELPELCIGETRNLLLELPFSPWSSTMIDQIYDMINRTGITPVIAHLERYLKLQRRDLLDEVLALGVPVQISGDALTKRMTRRDALSLLKSGGERLIASDCHREDSRPPFMDTALDLVQKKLGHRSVIALQKCADRLVDV